MKRLFYLFASLIFCSVEASAQKVEPIIIWSEKKLTWLDFKERFSYDKYPEANAKSTLQLKFEIHDSCSCAPKKFTIEVAALFYPNRSWVRKAFITNRKTLEHEQLHFDIVELLARRLRRDLSHKLFSGRKHMKEVNKMKRKYFRTFFSLNEQFDKETRGGDNLPQQEKWRAIVAKEMGELKDYTTNEVKIQWEVLKKSKP